MNLRSLLAAAAIGTAPVFLFPPVAAPEPPI
jgi:hypothetical protein